jgi:hypothetical protein
MVWHGGDSGGATPHAAITGMAGMSGRRSTARHRMAFEAYKVIRRQVAKPPMLG